MLVRCLVVLLEQTGNTLQDWLTAERQAACRLTFEKIEEWEKLAVMLSGFERLAGGTNPGALGVVRVDRRKFGCCRRAPLHLLS